ncbi:diguanylate cyclase [Rubrivivax sp. A210]|uniref:diguanylate cyclase n=1 Tax=Rubrivivax sp. A210 TaxID=2772301 RepID=UPI001918EFCA|nr:diguanylate cyclase [Rubrivivax sp. A210]
MQWLVVGVLALNLLVALLAATHLRSSHRAAHERTATATRNLARLLERDVSAALDRVGVALGSTSHQLEHQLVAGTIDRGSLWALLDAELALAPGASDLVVFDAEGAQVCGFPRSRCRHMNIADREHFLRHREQPTDLLLSGPLANRIDGEWSLILSRGLRRPDGGFAGVATAVLPLARFKDLFASLELGANGAVSLRGSDLRLLARHPGPLRMATEAENRKVSPQLAAAVAAKPAGGTYVAATAIDGIERGNAYLRSTRYPLYVIVGLGTADFLEDWRSDLKRALAIGLLFLAATGGLSAIAWTHWRRRDAYEARLRSTLDALTEGVVFQRQGGRIVDANPAAERILGLSRDQLLGLSSLDPRWLAVDGQGASLAGDRHPAMLTLSSGAPQHQFIMGVRLPGGDTRWLSVNTCAVGKIDSGGAPAAVVASFTDITASRLAEGRLRDSEAQLRRMNKDFVTLLESTSDFIYFKDQDSRIRFCSQTLARITGHASWRDMLGKHDREIFPPALAAVYEMEEAAVFEEGVAVLNRVDPYVDAAGQPGWVNTNKWPVFGDDGRSVVGIFGISRVVTEQKRLEDELRRLAATDALTGVASRRSLLESVQLELARLACQAAQSSSVLMFDLDHFKAVNDRHGHATGDAVLRHVAGLAAQVARPADTLGRLGGEEFAMLLAGSGLADARVIAERLRSRIAQTPLQLGGLGVGITVSIGVTALDAADATPEQVLARADQAMYRAKRLGRNRVDAEPALAG